jgi:perosamine synthetase
MIPVQKPFLGQEELDAVRRVFDSRWLGLGATTQEFEQRLREFLGVEQVIAVNTGTSALHLALEALDLQPGDEVIVPSLTFVASIQAILSARARPVFCEVQADTLNMDPDDVSRRLTTRTKVIMPVHYGGMACEMDELLRLARKHGLWVVEDAAHAFGSAYRGRPVGTLGDITCFSFDPIKNITCGEGGAVVTNNHELAQRIIPKRVLGIDNDAWGRLRNQQPWTYQVTAQGYRYHLPNLNAAIGLEQLKRVEVFKQRKLALARRYEESIGHIKGISLLKRNWAETFPFSYGIRVLSDRRDELMAYLRERGIGTGVNYIPNHLQPLFAHYRISLPVTEQLYREILNLPLYFEMTDSDLEKVIDSIHTFFQEERRYGSETSASPIH